MAPKIDPVIAEALGEIGKLHGLLKAHIEEVKRDRLQTQAARAEERLEHRAMRTDMLFLAEVKTLSGSNA